MSIKETQTITPQSDDNGISLSQTPAAGGAQNLTITGALASGGSVTLNQGTLILITAVGNESGRTLTVTGTDNRGLAITEAITGPNATTGTGSKYFKTITQIQIDADSAGAIEVGVSGKSSSKVYLVDSVSETNIGLACVLSGTLTYTVQHTFDDVQVTDLDSLTWFNHEFLAAKTATDDGNYAFPTEAVRVITTAWTSGTLKFNFRQAG